MDLNSTPVPDREFVLEKLDDEVLLYYPAKKTTIYMNETASAIWGLCNGERTVGEIIDLIKSFYPEAGRQIEIDVESTLEMFRERGAISL
ncbi:PqqD family protein [Pseudomonadota bacterium]